jgi:fatty acid desaturase
MPATAAPRFVLGVSLTMQSPSAVGSASPAVTPNAYREYLKAAGFSKDELKTIYAFNDRRAVLDFVGALTTTAAVPWLYWIYPSWITVVVCVLLSIHNFNALTQVSHASGHASFLSDTRWNAIVGEIACALRGFSRAGFALSHQMHHAFLNEEDDGDILFGRPDEPTRKLLLMCLQDLMLVTAFKRLLQYMQTDRKTYDQRPWDPWEKITIRFFVDRLGMMVPIAAAQMVLLGYYWIVIGPQYYFFFYLLPLATLYPAQIRLRSACEHSFEAGYDVASRGRWLSRSANASFLERFIVGPLCSDYHFEHHLLPTAPYYNLPIVRQILERKGIQVPLGTGYIGYLAQRWREERELALAA